MQAVEMRRVALYLAGGLFNAGEQLHNLMLERHLSLLGYDVILPQREAARCMRDGKLDLDLLADECKNAARDRSVCYVGSIDGAAADDGAAVEYGIAIEATHRAVVYRTDFRTDAAKELGMNAMFRLKHTRLVYLPANLAALDEVEPYYAALAREIDAAVKAVLAVADHPVTPDEFDGTCP